MGAGDSSPNDARIERPPSDAFELDAPGGASGDALSDDSNVDPPDGGPRVDASSDARPPMDAANDARDANPPPCRSISDVQWVRTARPVVALR
jgi:hypothetical protein